MKNSTKFFPLPRIIFLFAILLVVFFNANAQNGSIGIGTETPNPKSILDINSNSKGVLFPRLTTSDRNQLQPNGVSNPSINGLIIYNVTDNRFNFWFLNQWYDLSNGAMGPQGFKGDKGDQGAKGDIGLTGAVGSQGIQGIKGDQGVKGDIGLTGAVGSQGIQGIKGDKGDQGIKGDKGDIGLTGPAGIQGIQGIKGDIGLTGTTGSQGLQGIKGDKGDQGIQGIKGDKGDIGLTGAAGIQGIQGIKGDKGDKGNDGVVGIQGLTGPQGLQGVKGDPFKYSDFTATQLTSLTGPIGPQGLVGPTGSVGLIGPAGPQGNDGAQGIQGPLGPQGAQGPVGTQGPQGPQGAQGDTNGWLKVGNSGTTPGTAAAQNFIGTIDAKDVILAANRTERMRLLSGGGIQIGTTGTAITSVIKLKVTASFNIPANFHNKEVFSVPNATVGSSVIVSPTIELPDNILIAYARVALPGIVEVKFYNYNAYPVPISNDFNFIVIQ